ncbi:MAG TPA: M50 family metallopeptidase [Solirubrobacteraceae bacterium]|jgi:regulator of sigma E protease|nr:M50 family metallopeptidase [Solirubrobacteraceae bacterium]
MLSYVLAFAGFAVLVILHEAGHFVVAKAVGMRVERFALFFPPMIFTWRPANSETEYGIGCLPLGGYVRITGMSTREKIAPELVERAYYRQAVWKRIVVIAAGPAVNLVLAFMILWVLFAAHGVTASVPAVGSVTAGSPAAAVLRHGDRILTVDGRLAYSAGLSADESERRVSRMQKTVASHTCSATPTANCRAASPVQLSIVRDGERRTVAITPRYDAQLRRTVIGLSFDSAQFPLGVVAAASRSATTMWTITTTTATGIVRLFYDSRARHDVSGIVGSYEVVRQSFEFNVVQAIQLLAVISLSLAIVNLFPVLPLDGGHIFWALVEKLRGRPVHLRITDVASVVGLLLVGFLFVVGLHADIGRMTSGAGFGVR